MRRASHFLWSFGISLFLFFYVFSVNIIFTFLFSFLVGFFSFLPDIDIRITNRVDKFNRDTFYIFWIFNFWIKLFLKHRTITHSIWLPLFLFYFGEFVFFENFVFLNFFRVFYLAFFLHIFEDCFTVSGVDLFYPIKFNFRFGKFSTDSFLHYHLLNFFGFCFVVFFFFLYFY